MNDPMQGNDLSRTRRIGIASLVLLLLTVTLGIFLGVQTRDQFREIEASWNDYSDGVGRKGVWISSIRGYLGYGGIIHNFKNYVLRQEDVYLTRTSEQIASFMAITTEYLEATQNVEERAAIEAVRRTIKRYEVALPIAIQSIGKGWDAEQIDFAVRISDGEAIQALADLEALWTVNRQLSSDRMLAAVGRGQMLIWVGFLSIAALVVSSLLIGYLLLLLLKDMRGAMSRLSDELRKRRELQHSNEQLARAVEQSPATIFMTDTNAHIIYANAQFEKLTGWSREEVIGRTPRFLQSGDTPAAEYDAIRARLEKGQDWQGIFRNRCKDGTSYWAETKILPLVAADGIIRNYIGIGEDITEKRQAREQVAQAQKLEAVGLLAGGIAHDFNNILTTIVGAAHLAAMDAQEGSDLALEIDQIDIAARRAQSLVRSLLTFARRTPGHSQPNDLAAVIGEVSRLLNAAKPPTIELDCSRVDPDLMVLCDETHLHQIVMNLCRNAIEAIGGRAGTISINAHKMEGPLPDGLPPRPWGWVQFEVNDDGPGMSAETRQHLFDPFFTTKPLGKGSGLGLAVVFGLVEEIGGTIDVISQPNAGARFIICLPGADGANKSPLVQNTEIPRGRECIVLVDDQPEIAATFRRLLLRLGYRVDAFTSPVIALEHMRSSPERADLLISDMVMPDMGGEELVNQVRGFRPDIPVIFCTGYNPSGLKVDGPPAEMLNKPVDPAKLARRIRAMIDQKT